MSRLKSTPDSKKSITKKENGISEPAVLTRGHLTLIINNDFKDTTNESRNKNSNQSMVKNKVKLCR
jgi:hypothetical protein